MVMHTDSEAWLRREIARLTGEFRGTYGPETIERFARESLDALQGARFKDFLPVFAGQFARERLRALGQAEGKIAKDCPEVLLVCVHNTGRSQIAAALAQHLSGGRVHARSAGAEPAEEMQPDVVEAMAELGIDLSGEYPKPLTDEVVRAADVVITMGCGDACPIYPGKKYEDWAIEDPHGRPLEEVRRIRDAIHARVGLLLDGLGVPPQA